MSLSVHAKNLDGNLYALDQYMAEQDRNDALQSRIDNRTIELINTHTADIDDMLVTLVEDHPEKACEILKDHLSHKSIPELYSESIKNKAWFYNDFIPAECEKLAEKEFNG